MKGTIVCRLHNGKAPKTRAAALRRTLATTDEVVTRPIHSALDPGSENRVAKAAIVQLPDHSGVIAPADADERSNCQVLRDDFIRIHALQPLMNRRLRDSYTMHLRVLNQRDPGETPRS